MGWKRNAFFAIVPVMIFFASFILLANYAEASGSEYNKALIIVSDYQTNENENGKAVSFYEYLIEHGYDQNDIEFLASSSTMYSDLEANVSNVESAFNNLIDNNSIEKEVIIYLSDHGGPPCSNNTIFRFSDGNISVDQVDQWIGNISFSQLDVIVGGIHSGSAGPELAGSDRTIMCSMGSDEDRNPDLFNITRGLNDITADTDGNGEVSFVEAFWSEFYTVITHGQTPCIWE